VAGRVALLLANALATGGALALRLPWYRATVPGPHRARAADERPNHHTLKAALRERREVCAAQLLFQEAQSRRRVSCAGGALVYTSLWLHVAGVGRRWSIQVARGYSHRLSTIIAARKGMFHARVL
jgi:hypothetical protein